MEMVHVGFLGWVVLILGIVPVEVKVLVDCLFRDLSMENLEVRDN